MNKKGVEKIAYILKSHFPWMPGTEVLHSQPLPAWEHAYASEANMAIMKMMNYEPR